jgi:arylsulfatase A-like enzyme
MKPLIAALLISFAAPGLQGRDDERPNIIVFYTDDHGHADLSCQGVLSDIRTPHVDALAKSGVRAVHGYSTAPQCVPSRGGLMVGKFQGKFDLDSNNSNLDGFNRETTIAQRLQKAGYMTAQFGKWHLGPTEEIPKHGFAHVYSQNSQAPFHANITMDGKDRAMGQIKPEGYHLESCSRAAASLIERYQDQPFFLYIAYRAPHVPLDAPKRYLDRFPGEMPERRRQALAMLSAVDDGVGLVTETLERLHLTEKTLIFYIGDNGAPLKIHKLDEPGGGPGWDGSLNDPLNGEKGMLTEGGMHVPFVISWPGTIPGEQEFSHPVSALDVAATAAALANVETAPGDLDGVNLVPFLKGENQAPPHNALMWRWVAQSAIREGDWKLLRGGDREYLFDLGSDLSEKNNLSEQHPEIATRLRECLTAWSNTLNPPGLTTGAMAQTWNEYFDFYLEGKLPKTPPKPEVVEDPATQSQGWLIRNGRLAATESGLSLKSENKKARPFLTNNRLNLTGPVTATLRLRSVAGAMGTISWRTSQEKDFVEGSSVTFEMTGAENSQKVEVELPVTGILVHARITFQGSSPVIESIQLHGAQETKSWNWVQ